MFHPSITSSLNFTPISPNLKFTLFILKFRYLLKPSSSPKKIDSLMPSIGARFYTQLDSAYLWGDMVEGELEKESISIIKWGASSRWSFRPNSAWGSIETTNLAKTHPTLFRIFLSKLCQQSFLSKFFVNSILSNFC